MFPNTSSSLQHWTNICKVWSNHRVLKSSSSSSSSYDEDDDDDDDDDGDDDERWETLSMVLMTSLDLSDEQTDFLFYSCFYVEEQQRLWQRMFIFFNQESNLTA